MSHRRENVNAIEMLRSYGARLSNLETNCGVRQNNVRLSDWIMWIDENGCLICLNTKTKQQTTNCGPIESVTPESPICIPGVMGSVLWETFGDGDNILAWKSGAPPHYSHEAGSGSQKMAWSVPITGSQSIEATFTNFSNTSTVGFETDEIQLICRLPVGGDVASAVVVDILKTDGLPTSGVYSYEVWSPGFVYDNYVGSIPWPVTTASFTLRLESDADGTFRLFLDDSLLLTDIMPDPFTGPSRVGIMCFGSDFGDVAGDDEGSPWITDICIMGEDIG